MIRQQKLPERNLTRLMAEATQKNPQATALIHDSEVISYENLQTRIHRLAGNLSTLGISTGDRIGIWLPNIPEWIESFFSCAYLGAIAVSINTGFRNTEVGDILSRSGCKALIFSSSHKNTQFSSILHEISEDLRQKLEILIVVGEINKGIKSINNVQIIPYKLLLKEAIPVQTIGRGISSCIMFTTSGTTNLPKLVVHNQATISLHSEHVAISLNLDKPNTTILQAIPFCGVFGFSQAMAALSSGACLLCVPSFNVNETLKLIQSYRVTHLNGSDEMFDRLVEYNDNPAGFSSVEFCGYANFTPSLSDVVKRTEKSGLKLVGLYGASELLAFLAVQKPSASSSERARMGGFPVDKNTKVRVRNPESGKLMHQGSVGELEFKCTSLMEGYYQNPEATKSVFTIDGFFRSGDLGKLCKDGSFAFLSRMGDMLRLGGFLVNPEEIENFIQGYPKILECQVVGINRPRKPACVAFIIIEKESNINAQEINQFCQANLAKYKVPSHIFFVEKFPTTTGPNGTKIQRNILRDLAEKKILSDNYEI
jgi:fatty-acyl-CoA synthase